MSEEEMTERNGIHALYLGYGLYLPVHRHAENCGG